MLPVMLLSPCPVPLSRTEGTFGTSASCRVRNPTAPRAEHCRAGSAFFLCAIPWFLCQGSEPALQSSLVSTSLPRMKSELSQLITHRATDKENTFEHHCAKPAQLFVLPLYLSCPAAQVEQWGILKTAFLISGVMACRRVRPCLVRWAVHSFFINQVFNNPATSHCALSSSERCTPGPGLPALESAMDSSFYTKSGVVLWAKAWKRKEFEHLVSLRALEETESLEKRAQKITKQFCQTVCIQFMRDFWCKWR